ncbi:hypothetical protein IFM89_007068 [Coptis chinensis]|uniref:Uncharacterized protein n=1 Tax=Coptis chinensis TaxID=261450 RepID=A0A835IAL7_9MAGN|nr:hypothetical protein IFM89_007068 [Coptis chinensis]
MSGRSAQGRDTSLNEPLIKPPTLLPPVISRHGFSANFLHNDIPHRVGNIWVFWREGLAVTLVSLSHQQIIVRVNSFLMSFVHASSSYGLRRELWQDLSQLRMNNEAWAVIREINITQPLWAINSHGVIKDGEVKECSRSLIEYWLIKNGKRGMLDGGAKFSHGRFLITALLWAGTLASGLERLGLTMNH